MRITRQQLESFESQTLASYALRSADSQGRDHPEDEPLYRTAFQRDRDRIVHTTAFRRLEYKTQVFVTSEGDYYRTRLTHTIEVAQAGRSLARALGANEDLVEAICLAHDLGHAPFGHVGEETLRALMHDHGGFDHNKQSLRIVTELERRYPAWPGLNLTYEVREGIAKHETEYDLSNLQGYRPDRRGSLEAQITNMADELTYNAHDLDDGLRSGLITHNQLADLELWQMLCQEVGYSGSQFDDLTRHRIIRRLIGLEITDVIETSAHMIEEAGVQSPEDVQRLSYNLMKNSDVYNALNRPLKDFLRENLYHHYHVIRMKHRAERCLTDLFNAYIAEPALLPPSVHERVQLYGLHRAVTDYIAGMTDRFALQEWQRW